jgi:hypothetical protein
MQVFLLGLIFLFSFIFQASGLIHHLQIVNDERRLFKIETFGFVSGGLMDLTLSDLKLHAPSYAYYNSTSGKKAKNNKPDDITYSMGFLMRRADSESDAQQDLETIIEKGECILDKKRDVDFFFDLSDTSKWHKTTVQHVVDADSAGLYSLIFTRCTPSSLYFTSFKLDVKFTNPGPNYLSAGDVPLPTVYLFFFLLHVCALVAWIFVLNRDQTQYGTVHRIHYMMLVLLVFKILSVLFESIRYHYIAIFGVSEMWSILYYIFTFLKGIMLFTVIMLIGSGYSLMKSYLNDNEKKIIMVVLALQVLDNIAMVVLEETAPGTQGWLTWRDILHIVDILCCLAILLPIVWSMKHLRYPPPPPPPLSLFLRLTDCSLRSFSSSDKPPRSTARPTTRW